MIVYLGGSKGVWRKEVEKAFPKWVCINPFDGDQRSLATFTVWDLECIECSDIILFLINYPVYTGSCLEAGFAYAKGKPIYLVWNLKNERIDPMLLGVSYRVFLDLNSAIKYLKRKYK